MDTPHHVRAISQLANARTLDAPFTSNPRRWRFTQAAVFVLSAGIATLYAYRAPAAGASVGSLVADGVVTQRGSAKPLAGVTVVLDGATTAKTDAQGHFHFGGLAAGGHALRLTGEGLTTVDAEITVQDGANQFALDLQRKDQAPAGEAPVEAEVVVIQPAK